MNIYQQHIKELRNTAENERMERAQRKKDYYEGRFIDYRDELLQAHFKNWDKMQNVFEYINILEYFTDKRAQILKNGVEINIEKNDEILSEWLENNGVISDLKQFEKYAELLGMVAVRFFRDNGEVNYEMIPPNRFYVLTDQENSLKPVFFVWQRQNYTEVIPEELIYFAYDEQYFYKFNTNGEILQQEKHGYNGMPVAFLFAKKQSDNFYIESDEDLRLFMENTAMWLTSINHLEKYQGFSQPVAKGLPSDAKIITDPSTIIRTPFIPEIGAFGDFEYKTPEAKIKEIWETLVAKLRMYGGRYNVNVNELIKDVSQRSGVAYAWENLNMKESREDREEIWRHNIKNFIRKYLLVKSSLNPVIDPEQKITVDFPDIVLIEDPDKEINRWLVLIGNNIRNKLDWIKADNPDIKTDEEAKTKLLENIKINNDLESISIGEPEQNAGA